MDGVSVLTMLFRQRIVGNRAALDATVAGNTGNKSVSVETKT